MTDLQKRYAALIGRGLGRSRAIDRIAADTGLDSGTVARVLQRAERDAAGRPRQGSARS